MDNWDEIKTAYQVARMGTVSGAAEVLGVHHATVIRHIDALETRLGAKLFQRHARGYTATEAGQDLMQVAQTTNDQFSQLAGRIHGRGAAVSGELVVTTVAPMSALVAEAMAGFQREHPEIRSELIVDNRVLRLEYGEAHVAIRAGAKDEHPDNIVQNLADLSATLCAHQSYIDQFGLLKGDDDIRNHRFVSLSELSSRVPFHRWIMENVPPENIVFRASNMLSYEDAIAAGAGIGLMPIFEAYRRDNIVELRPDMPELITKLWVVTHVDLHRTSKVQGFTKYLKEAAKSWASN